MIIGKKVAILAEQDFEDSELVQPGKALADSGAHVIIVGSGSKQVYSGKRGTATIKADITADELNVAAIDAVIIPGGYAPDKMRLYPAMIDLVRNAYKKGKLIAAICHGPQMLISANIVRGKRITSWPSIRVDLENAGALWVDKPAVKDGNLITSRKPTDIPIFNKEIIRYLNS
jgi:protease I